jgi:hypothetical protein
MAWAFDFDLERVGNNMPARMAITAITTSNSTKVNPWLRLVLRGSDGLKAVVIMSNVVAVCEFD